MDLGPYAAWGETERTVALVYGAYRSLDPTVPEVNVMQLLAAMAEWTLR